MPSWTSQRKPIFEVEGVKADHPTAIDTRRQLCSSYGQPLGHRARDPLNGLLDRRGEELKPLRHLPGRSPSPVQRHCSWSTSTASSRSNDEHGHLAVNAILTAVAGTMAGRSRTRNVVCRYRGPNLYRRPAA